MVNYYPLIAGVLCLFFPSLMIFGYNSIMPLELFDWLVAGFLLVICFYLIILGLVKDGTEVKR